ncbi:MAG: cell division protein FtsA [Bacteroidota bacterium]
MKNAGIIVGLDIGTTKIAVIVGRKNEFGKIEILGYGKVPSIGVKRGVVSNIENTVQSIKEAVAEASQKSGVEIQYVNVGIAGQHIKSLQHRGSMIRNQTDTEISQQDIDNLCNSMYNLNMSPGEEILEVVPQEFSVDGEHGIRQPKGMIGSSLDD